MAEHHEFAGLAKSLPRQRLVADLCDRIRVIAPTVFPYIEQAFTRTSGDIDALVGSVVKATQNQNPATRAEAARALAIVGEATSALT